MADDIHDEIERLEARIEELSDSIEGCRKAMLIAKLAIGAGALLLLGMLFGIAGDGAVALIAAIVAATGGIVVLGSNRTTFDQLVAERQEAEAERVSLIGSIDLRVVPFPGSIRPTLH